MHGRFRAVALHDHHRRRRRRNHRSADIGLDRAQRIRVDQLDRGRNDAAADQRRHGIDGVTGIAERARILGSRLHVVSAPGQGTRLELEVPVLDRGGSWSDAR